MRNRFRTRQHVALYFRYPIASLVVVSVLVACGDNKQGGLEAEIPEEYVVAEVVSVEQDVRDRIFTNWSLEEVSLQNAPSIGMVGQLRVHEDKFYVYDISSMDIKRYSISGELEVIYGEGRGQGPGEFTNIFSFWPYNNDVLWVIDSMSRTVSQFHKEEVM